MIKTEQEQRRAIADVLCDYCKNNTKIGEPCKSSNGTYICTSEIRRAAALVQAGYGDVSEYKAEIERLKSEIIKQDQVIIERNFELVELEDKVKQAKIDVLNELKSRHDYAVKNMGYPWDISQQIDRLIEEVEKQ